MVAPKAPLNNDGNIRIRFTHNGTRFTLASLGQYSDKVALKYAQSICDRIALDIASGNFICTNNGELALRYHQAAIPAVLKQVKPITLPKQPDLTELLEKRLGENFCSSDKSLISLLRQYGKKIYDETSAYEFLDWIGRDRKTSTVKRYLNTLQVISPLFKGISITIEVKPLPKPFAADEVKAIIAWFRANQYYSHYADYVRFLFLTGTRTSEAIGLQWKHLDFNRSLLFIYESLGRKDGSSSNRERRTTKTNKMREFPLSNGLLEMLKERYEASDKNPESLVFPSPTGKAIDDHNFSQRAWRSCLKELNIQHRPQYNTRHTFISHFLEKTKDVVKCASLTHGSKSGIQTIFQNYAGIINRVEVPDLFQ